MNPLYKEIFNLYYYNNLSLKEISLLIGKNYLSVKEAIRHSRNYIIHSVSNPEWAGPIKHARRDMIKKTAAKIQKENNHILNLYRQGIEPKIIARETNVTIKTIHNVVQMSKDKKEIQQERNEVIVAKRENDTRLYMALFSKYRNQKLVARKSETSQNNIFKKLNAVQDLLQDFKDNIQNEQKPEEKQKIFFEIGKKTGLFCVSQEQQKDFLHLVKDGCEKGYAVNILEGMNKTAEELLNKPRTNLKEDNDLAKSIFLETSKEVMIQLDSKINNNDPTWVKLQNQLGYKDPILL